MTATMDSCFPDFALLDADTRISHLRNGTTAWALTTQGLTIQVSFVMAAPPRLSYFCVCCPSRHDDDTLFAYAPRVVCSTGDRALIQVVFTTAGDSPPTQHFMSYGPMDRQYYLHTLSSEPHSTWSKKLMQVELPHGVTRKSVVISPRKVIALGGGLLGWVDLWEGILICDVLEPGAAALRFVPMPKLLPSNKQLYNQCLARSLRDVTFSRGYIKCVQFEKLVELRARTVPAVPDPWDMDELQDLELAMNPPQEEEEEEEYVVVGWRLITWYRALTWNCWRKGNTVHSDELGTVSLPQLGVGGGGASARKVALKDLKTATPTLHGEGDVVYLVSMLRENNQQTAWIVSVDTRRKSVGELLPSTAQGVLLYDPTYISYVLTEYLDAKSDEAQVGKRNACHVPTRNMNMSKKQRQQLPQAGLEEQPPVPQLLQPSSGTMVAS